MGYNFHCPFCNTEYQEFEGLYYSNEVSKKDIVKIKCKKCKERFALTVNVLAGLVTYKDPVIKDRKEYNKMKKRESRKKLAENFS